MRGARWRLTAGYALVWLTMVVVLTAVAYVAMARTLDREVDAGIRSVVDAWLAQAPPLERLRPVDVEREFEGETAGVFLLVFGADSTLLANPNRVDVEELFEHANLEDVLRRGGWREITVGGQRLRVLAQPVVQGGAVTGTVLGGRSLVEHERAQRALLVVLAAAGAVGLALASAGGYVLAGRALRPLALAYDRQRAFVGDASHELRAPLTVIRTSADLLLREDLPPAAISSVEEIRDVAAEATVLVQDLLGLARLERATLEDVATRLDIAAGVVLGQMRSLLDAHGSTVATALSPVAARIEDGAARRLVRALLENVLTHTPPGTAVEVETGIRAGRAFLAVRDRGAGVPNAELERIFERFSQLDDARTPGEQRGAGLGLAIVQAIAAASGGSTRALNRPGGGLEVEVLLSLAPSGGAAVSEAGADLGRDSSA